MDNKNANEATEKRCMQKSQTVASVGFLCPSCNQPNDQSAIFCQECGTSLKQPAQCLKCGANVRPHADICEVCGAWLLEGQCRFCYAHVDEGHAFCGECGNPPNGIVCSHCGELSIFDFCKICNIPLSIQAKETMQENSKDPAFQKLASLFEIFTTPVDIPSASSIEAATEYKDKSEIKFDSAKDQILKLKAYHESFSTPAISQKINPAPKSLFSNTQKSSINLLADEVAKEEEHRRIEEDKRKRREEEERRRQEAERQRKIQEQLAETLRNLSHKTFTSSQEARCFFMSMVTGIPEELRNRFAGSGIGWRCNAYDCVHTSPGDCADPSQGGVWLLR